MTAAHHPDSVGSDDLKKPRTSYFRPWMFQATPASIFPPCTSGYYHFDDLLTPEEQALRINVRQCIEKEVAPIMAKYWEEAEFPFHVIPKLGALRIAGGTIKGYGCPGLSITGSAITTAEIARVDASCSTLFWFTPPWGCSRLLYVVRRNRSAIMYLLWPNLKLWPAGCASLHAVGFNCEPDYGSDASALKTTATKLEGGWILEGQKRWIGNSTFADLLMIFARNTSTSKINGFIVKKDVAGLKFTKIENKIGLRIVQNGDIVMRKVFVSDSDRLPGVNSFQDTNKVLAVSRIMVAWQPIGISMGAYDICHRYLKERKQFRAPLAAFQLNQQKLVQMLGNIQAMFLVGWCLMRAALIFRFSFCSHGSRQRPGRVVLGRELLGGNGILSDFLVAKEFCDLESIYTYEGTYDINTLVTSREVAGLAGFEPATSSTRSRL